MSEQPTTHGSEKEPAYAFHTCFIVLPGMKEMVGKDPRLGPIREGQPGKPAVDERAMMTVVLGS